MCLQFNEFFCIKFKAEEAGDFELKAVELQSRYEELEARIRQNGHVPTTPDSDRKLLNVRGIYGDFYGMKILTGGRYRIKFQ